VAFYFAHIFNGPQNSPYKALKGIKMLQIEIKTFPNDFLEKKEEKKFRIFLTQKINFQTGTVFVRFCAQLSEWRHMSHRSI